MTGRRDLRCRFREMRAKAAPLAAVLPTLSLSKGTGALLRMKTQFVPEAAVIPP